jgi:hypothetical protein
MKESLTADISDYWKKGRGFIALLGFGASLLVVANFFVVKVFGYVLLGTLASVILDFLSFRGHIKNWKAVLVFAFFLFVLYISQSHPYSPTYQGRMEAMSQYPSGIVLSLDCEHYEKVTLFIPHYAEINFRGHYPSVGDDVWASGVETDGRVVVEDPEHMGFHNFFW